MKKQLINFFQKRRTAQTPQKKNQSSKKNDRGLELRLKVANGLKLLDLVSPALSAEIGTLLFCWPGPRLKMNPKNLPEGVVQRFVPTRYGRIRVYVSENKAPKGRVLLAHGWAGHPMQFKSIVHTLLKNGYSVVLYDQHAHGESQGILSSLPDFVGTLEDVLAVFPDVKHMVGHSFGALALLWAGGMREYLRKGIHSIVAISAPQSPSELTRDVLRLYGFKEKGIQQVARIIGRRKKVDLYDYEASVYGPQLECPVLLIHDELDSDVTISHAHGIAKSLKNKTVKITQGLGHKKILSDAETIRLILEFLDANNLKS